MERRLGYVPALDGLRGIAVLMVLGLHAFKFPRGGFLGVDLFFVLSGFLITSLLLQEHAERGDIALRSFYRRRWLRLAPAHLSLVVAVSLVSAGIGIFTLEWLGVSALHLTNVITVFGNSETVHLTFRATSHLWTLAMEEQFYVLWPIALATMLRRDLSIKRMQVLVVFGIASVFLWRIYLTLEGAGASRIYAAPDTRADTLLVGCLLGLLWHAHPSIVRRFGQLAMWPSIALLIFGAIFFVEANAALPFGGYTLVALGCACIIAAAIDVRPSWLGSHAMVWLGKRSYSLYIWHFFVLWLFDPQFGSWVLDSSSGPDLHLLPALLMSFGAAELSYRFIEEPFLRRRRERGRKLTVTIGSAALEKAA
ncbi:MAG: acyltransferase family protein [Acidimicrobiia bacterium]